jgi:hypothetical protein
MNRFRIDFHDEYSGEVEVYDSAIDCTWFGRVFEKHGESKVDRTAWRDNHDSEPSMELKGDLGDFMRSYLSLKDIT